MRDFENRTPLDDEMTVLDLLVHRWADNTTREIDRRFKSDGPYVEIEHLHDFTDGAIYRFKITDRVADALLAKRLVAGRPEWGHTDIVRWGHP